MTDTIPNYMNAFGEPVTKHDLEHMFDILNETNDDRISSRDLGRVVQNVGLKLTADELREAYNHIATSIDKKSKAITKASWTAGIDTAHKQSNTHSIYKYILSGGQYDPQKKRKEISFSEIKKALSDTKKSPWKYRIECLESFCRQLTAKKVTKEKFHSIFRVHHIPLIKQAKDRRSNVMRVACQVLSKIIRKWQNEYLRYSYKTIEYIFELIRQKIFVVHITGFKLLSTLLKHCTDHKELKIMHILGREATSSKFINLQQYCFDLLFIYFESETNNKHKTKDVLYQDLLKYVAKGIQDSDEIRNSALKLLAQIECAKPKMTKPLIKKMNIHLKKRYDEEYRIKNNEKKRKKAINKKGNENEEKTSVKTEEKEMKVEKDDFLNGFGFNLSEIDIVFAFEFVNTKNDGKITMNEFKTCCKRLDVDGKYTDLFSYFDDTKCREIDLQNFKRILHQKEKVLMDFWCRLLSGKHLEQNVKATDLKLQKANTILSNDLNQGFTALYAMTRTICSQKVNEDKVKESLDVMLSNLCDAQSVMIREICICLAKIIMVKKDSFDIYTLYILKNLYKLMELKEDKTRISAAQCLDVMVKYIYNADMVGFIMEHCGSDKGAFSRIKSLQCLNGFLSKMIEEFEGGDEIFWGNMVKVLECTVHDKDSNIQQYGYHVLVNVELLNNEMANKYIDTLNKSDKQAFDACKKDTLHKLKESSGNKHKKKKKKKKKTKDEMERDKLYQELLKLKMQTLKRKCRSLRISAEGSKLVMIQKIMDNTASK